MEHLARTMVTLLLFNGWFAINLSMFRPLVPIYLASLGMEALGVGVMLSAYSLVPALISLWVPLIISSLSLRRLFLSAALLSLAGFAVFSSFSAYPALFAAQLSIGISQVLVVLGSQSYISSAFPKARLVHAFSLMVAAYGGASVVGPLLGGFLAQGFSYRTAFLIIGLSSLGGLSISAFFGKERVIDRRPVPVTWVHLRDVLASPTYRFSLLLTVASISLLSLCISFYPLYLESVGYGPGLVGVLLSLRGLGEFLTPPALGSLEPRLGRKRLVLFALALVVGALFAIPLLSGMLVLGVMSLLLGLVFGLFSSISLGLATEETASDSRAMALGFRFTFNRGMDSLGPIVFGASAFLWGYGAPFYLVAVYLSIVVVAVRSRLPGN